VGKQADRRKVASAAMTLEALVFILEGTREAAIAAAQAPAGTGTGAGTGAGTCAETGSAVAASLAGETSTAGARDSDAGQAGQVPTEVSGQVMTESAQEKAQEKQSAARANLPRGEGKARGRAPLLDPLWVEDILFLLGGPWVHPTSSRAPTAAAPPRASTPQTRPCSTREVGLHCTALQPGVYSRLSPLRHWCREYWCQRNQQCTVLVYVCRLSTVLCCIVRPFFPALRRCCSSCLRNSTLDEFAPPVPSPLVPSLVCLPSVQWPALRSLASFPPPFSPLSPSQKRAVVLLLTHLVPGTAARQQRY